MMTKEEFISGYCERSDITKEEFRKELVALQCRCNSELCEGWAAVINDEFHIRLHNEIYSPGNTDDIR